MIVIEKSEDPMGCLVCGTTTPHTIHFVRPTSGGSATTTVCLCDPHLRELRAALASYPGGKS